MTAYKSTMTPEEEAAWVARGGMPVSDAGDLFRPKLSPEKPAPPIFTKRPYKRRVNPVFSGNRKRSRFQALDDHREVLRELLTVDEPTANCTIPTCAAPATKTGRCAKHENLWQLLVTPL